MHLKFAWQLRWPLCCRDAHGEERGAVFLDGLILDAQRGDSQVLEKDIAACKADKKIVEF